MDIKRDWPKIVAVGIFFTLLGAFYDRLSVETRTLILPLLIFAAAAFVLGRLLQMQNEVRSSRVTALEIVAKQLSLADEEGQERISIYVSSDSALMTFYDKDHVSCVTLALKDKEPVLSLIGENGSAVLAIDEDGMPSLTLRDRAEQIMWSAL